MRNESLLAQVSPQLCRLEKRDWELWAIVSGTGILVSLGLSAIILPSALLKNDNIHFEITVSRESLEVETREHACANRAAKSCYRLYDAPSRYAIRVGDICRRIIPLEQNRSTRRERPIVPAYQST